MTKENELARLEGFVSTLLEKYNGLQDDNKGLTERLQQRDASIESLQDDNKELTERLQRRDESIETLQDELASMKDERGEITTRVSSLIGKIEEWEADSGVTEDSVEPDEDPVEKEKNESGVQGNLFGAEATGE